MEHRLYSDGNQKKISWIIQTGESTEQEDRVHVDEYIDKVTEEQSKYITLHVGIFWGVGRFIILLFAFPELYQLYIYLHCGLCRHPSVPQGLCSLGTDVDVPFVFVWGYCRANAFGLQVCVTLSMGISG